MIWRDQVPVPEKGSSGVCRGGKMEGLELFFREGWQGAKWGVAMRGFKWEPDKVWERRMSRWGAVVVR